MISNIGDERAWRLGLHVARIERDYLVIYRAGPALSIFRESAATVLRRLGINFLQALLVLLLQLEVHGVMFLGEL